MDIPVPGGGGRFADLQGFPLNRVQQRLRRRMLTFPFLVEVFKVFAQGKVHVNLSGCAYNGITDVVTNLLMKVQNVAVSENSAHNSCVSLTVVWTWNFLLSRQT